MPDRDGALEVHGTAAANGAVANRDPDALVAEIERTRENLARTIDNLTDRVSPAANMRRARQRVQEQFKRPEVQLAAAAVGLAVVGATILVIRRRRRA